MLDAFSSDAVPVHLLSREAIRLYRSKLDAGGLLVFNLSNRYLDLEPVIGRQAEDAGMVCRVCYDLDVSDEGKRAGKQPSIWAVMAASDNDLGGLAGDTRWRSPALRRGSAVWTDDYSDLASYLILVPGGRWRRDRAAALQRVVSSADPLYDTLLLNIPLRLSDSKRRLAPAPLISIQTEGPAQ